MHIAYSMTDVRIERIPIVLTKLSECRLGVLTIDISRREHDAPMSGSELPSSGIERYIGVI